MFEGMCAGIVHTSDNKETDMTGQLWQDLCDATIDVICVTWPLWHNMCSKAIVIRPMKQDQNDAKIYVD